MLGETEGNERTSLGLADVTEDVNGIKQLIAAGSLRAAVNLTLRCLTTYGQGFGRAGQLTRHTPHSLQLWFTRFALLIKLGEYDLCKREAEAFSLLERPDMFYDVSQQLRYGQNSKSIRFYITFPFFCSFIQMRIAIEKDRWHRFRFVC